MTSILEALSLLTPFDIDKPKRRLGPSCDGGYVFVDNLRPEQVLVSYGISTEYRLEEEFARNGHQVYMFDHTVEGANLSQNMQFFKEGVAGTTDAAASLYSLADHITRHRIDSRDMILKMDVEGAEYAAILDCPMEVLASIDQIVIEIHSLDLLAEPQFRQMFSNFCRKLNSRFTLCHVHANNFDGPDTFHYVGGLPVPMILELTYVRSCSVERRASSTIYPTSLDFPNNGSRDKVLWSYPFFPSSISRDALTSCMSHIDNVDKLISHGL